MTLHDALLASARRVLSLMDRSSASLTRGCLDRNYWQYKAVTDFPGATWQQPLYGMALLYRHPFPGNVFHRSPVFLEWIEAGLLWWAGIQNRDGSFDEWYSGERSFCATAFTAWSAAAAVTEVGEELSPAAAGALDGAIQSAGRWLCLHENPDVGNQTAASLAALTTIHRLTGDETFKRAADLRKEQLLSTGSSEGWFPEYGGADPGYGFVTLELLADAARRTGDGALDEAAAGLLRWLAPLVHPDGTLSGAAGSRGGELVLPGGLALCSDREESSYLWNILSGAVKGGWAPAGHSVDDRYLAHFVFNSLARAAAEGFPPVDTGDPGYAPPPLSCAPLSGFAALHQGPSHVLLSLGGGGAVTVYTGGRAVFRESGWIAVDGEGRGYVTQHPGRGVQGSFEGDGPENFRAGVTVPFRRWDRNRPPGGLVIPFKAAARLLLPTGGAARAFSRKIRERKVVGTEAVPLTVRRRYVLAGGRLEITDRFSGNPGAEITALVRNGGSFLGHSPSGRLFDGKDLLARADDGAAMEEALRLLNGGRTCTVTTKVPLAGDGVVETTAYDADG